MFCWTKNCLLGHYETAFNASELSSGIYFCKMETDNYSQTIKMLLLE